MIIDVISTQIKETLKPMKLICVGSDEQPATEEDIKTVMEYWEENKELPKNFPSPLRQFNIKRSPLPGVLLVKLGSANRPASVEDMGDLQKQLADCAHDSELTLITHHCVSAEWVSEGVGLVAVQCQVRE